MGVFPSLKFKLNVIIMLYDKNRCLSNVKLDNTLLNLSIQYSEKPDVKPTIQDCPLYLTLIEVTQQL